MVKVSALVTEGNVNEALRNALRESGLTQLDLAAQLSVDPKTVEKWLAGRGPHPRTRTAVAELVGRSENELWPVAAVSTRLDTSNNEIRTVYPHRWAVPRDVWRKLFQQAEHQIDILVYSGLFLAEDAGIVRLLIQKAESGVSIRLLLGDPDSPEVAQRGMDEGVSGIPSARIRNALALFQPLSEMPSATTRLHRTALYNSIFRGDSELLVNPHIYGIAGATAPVLHLRRSQDGEIAKTYIESFEQIWDQTSSLISQKMSQWPLDRY